MVVVAKTHVRSHGIASGEMMRETNDLRLGLPGPITRGLAASSMSAEDRGSSANRTLSAFSGSLGLVGDRKGMMSVVIFCCLVLSLVVLLFFLLEGNVSVFTTRLDGGTVQRQERRLETNNTSDSLSLMVVV